MTGQSWAWCFLYFADICEWPKDPRPDIHHPQALWCHSFWLWYPFFISAFKFESRVWFNFGACVMYVCRASVLQLAQFELSEMSQWSATHFWHFIFPLRAFTSIGMLISCGFSVMGFRLWSTVNTKCPAPFEPQNRKDIYGKITWWGGGVLELFYSHHCVACDVAGFKERKKLCEVQRVCAAYLCSSLHAAV